ncbi:antibiotic biosynthesis monooxygenase [Amycolatopsis sp. WAC 01376]|uniref:putative quinol monooxygenase n=1 Tax=Amycolatopsis sp. WAC 01376 TaxID=2203195 RepID=UPI000F7A2ADA|nr:putative quinol monooxygenase [Amycolatopsis sp. WAC 01376]RSM62947.1 antibiotic biosynthesis monooxygenase [Amycolatopsis sp. WAC 01376]
MIFVVVARYVTAHRDRVLELLEPMAAASLREPGCVGYTVHSGTEDGVVVIVEEYESEQDFTGHCESEHFRRIVLGEVVPLLSERQVTTCVPAGSGR